MKLNKVNAGVSKLFGKTNLVLLANLMRTRSINFRIGVLLAVSLLGLSAIATTHFVGDAAQHRATKLQMEAGHLITQVSEIKAALMQMDEQQKEFQLSYDPKAPQVARKDAEFVHKTLQELNYDIADESMRVSAKRMQAQIPIYIETMNSMVAERNILGKSPEDGLLGELRTAIHGVEKLLLDPNFGSGSTLEVDKVMIKMLMMRRHEKDFMLRGSEKYIHRLDKRVEETQALLKASNLPQQQQIKAIAALKEYQIKFLKFTQSGAKLATLEASMKTIFHQIEPLSEVLSEHGHEIDEHAIKAEHAARSTTQTIMVSAIVLIFLLVAIANLTMAVSISQPIGHLTTAMRTIAGGAFETPVPGLTRGDEIGVMANALETFRQTAINGKALIEAQREEEGYKTRRAHHIEKASIIFEKNIETVIKGLTDSASTMSQSTTELSAVTKETVKRSTEVTDAVHTSSSNVTAVASATEELSASVSEIQRQIIHTRDVSQKAKIQTKQSEETVGRLAHAASQINDVVTLINDIANQTNLLALNATIEAARAGEAGKGFAVVANEVKALAGQTANATDEIVKQIQTMQNVTEETVSAISEITTIMESIGEGTAEVASAIEEQTTATQEISQNVQGVSENVNIISNNMEEVNKANEKTSDTSTLVSEAAFNLTGQSNSLRTEVDVFLKALKTA
ncbi:MAG: HAMP domain-containing protein [Parvibaculaceae bacterium]|nr:HAMP domain-containing protein [Parvibaculaceae bacterium]